MQNMAIFMKSNSYVMKNYFIINLTIEIWWHKDWQECKRIGSDFASTISYTTFFHRIQSEMDNDRMQIQKRICWTADLRRKPKLVG
jgi:hypothetical protein